MLPDLRQRRIAVLRLLLPGRRPGMKQQDGILRQSTDLLKLVSRIIRAPEHPEVGPELLQQFRQLIPSQKATVRRGIHHYNHAADFRLQPPPQRNSFRQCPRGFDSRQIHARRNSLRQRPVVGTRQKRSSGRHRQLSRQEKIGRGIVTGYDQVVTGRGQLGSERLDIAGGRHDAGAVTHSQFEILIIGHHPLLGQAVLETVTQIFSPNIRRGMRIDQQNPFHPERLRTSARINFRHPRQHQQGQQQNADISLHFPHIQNRIRQEIGSQSL